MFEQVGGQYPRFWSFQLLKTIKIISQSDFVKPLQRFELPTHTEIIKRLIDETLDPATDAFKTWLWFMQNTRDDPLMSPKAWFTESGARTVHERVRFLTAMYWTDGIVIPLLWKTVFPSQNPVEKKMSPIFVCGVTRDLQAEMEMAGPNLKMQGSSLNGFEKIAQVRRPTSAIHILKNTAMWTGEVQAPFSFGGKVLLK